MVTFYPSNVVWLSTLSFSGLVFPQIVHSKAHLVLNGVSPIDHLWCVLLVSYNVCFICFLLCSGDYVTPIQIICDLIPDILIRQYNLNTKLLGDRRLPRIDALHFLTALARSRGFISGGRGGSPDLFQASKLVLRDFTLEKLPHYALPPDSASSPPESLQTPCEALEQNDDDLLLESIMNHSAQMKRMTRRAMHHQIKREIRGKGSIMIRTEAPH